jgi:hypothetical protein
MHLDDVPLVVVDLLAGGAEVEERELVPRERSVGVEVAQVEDV